MSGLDAGTSGQGFGPGLEAPGAAPFGEAFAETTDDVYRSKKAGDGGGSSSARKGGDAGRSRGDGGIQGGVGDRPSSSGSGNLGFARKTGNRRVIGAGKSVLRASVNGDGVLRSYSLAKGIQFNDVEEMQADAISRAYAQEIVEELFLDKWMLDTKDSVVMKKAEDVLHAFVVMRTASPYASYDQDVMIGEKEVSLQALSDLLVVKEVQRRRFTRAISDDLKNYILDDSNYRLRNILATTLGIYPQYVHLAFDGSTHCSGLNRHEVAFTKALESSKLFDDQGVQGKLSNSSLLDGVFDSGSSAERKRVRV